MTPRRLSKREFLEVISRTPLVSIDLIIRDSKNRIFLGRRKNEPAGQKWFVPGGRIFKCEDLDDAFERISKNEIGERHYRNEARLVGVFTHKYRTNVFLEDNVSTHYVVLAYEIFLSDDLEIGETEQHSEYKWFSTEDADPEVSEEADPDVHEYVIEYFRLESMMDDDQYKILNARRDSFNTLLWQTPVLGLTAQAFLFIIILSENISIAGRSIAAFLAAISALLTIQLLGKHRFMELQHAKILHAYEEIHKSYAANRQIKTRKWPNRLSAFKQLRLLFWVFFGMAIIGALLGWFGFLGNPHKYDFQLLPAASGANLQDPSSTVKLTPGLPGL